MNDLTISKELSGLFDSYQSGSFTRQKFYLFKPQLKKVVEKQEAEMPEKVISVIDNMYGADNDSGLKLELTRMEALKLLGNMDIRYEQKNLIFYTIDSLINDYKKAELLLIAGINPNEIWCNTNQKRDIYPLHNTAGFGTTRMVKLLLSYGASINLEDKRGFTALFYAIEYGTTAIAKVLIDRGADINHKAGNKINPLYFARMKKKPEMRELLLKAGAEEMHPDEIRSIEKMTLVKKILLTAAVIIICLFIGYTILDPFSDSASSHSYSANGS
jgi:hypothetical protein